jgi:hypothetical protein
VFRIENTATEKYETAKKWTGAMLAVSRLSGGDLDSVIVREWERERDYRDGDPHIAEFNGHGQKLREDGHYR